MRDSKSISLLVLSSVLLLLSVVLLGTLGYQYYRQGNPPADASSRTRPQSPASAVVAAANPDSVGTRDSLRKIYNLALTNFEGGQDLPPTSKNPLTDSSATDVANNLKEYYRLKDEIALLLQEKSSNADMILARQKIAELQMKVELLSYRNSDVEKENRRLYAMLEKLSRPSSTDGGPVFSNTPTSNGTRSSTRTFAAPILSAGNLNLSARAADTDQETSDADETEKLVGSFTIKNTGGSNVSDIVVVVVQPNGQVLQKSAWESGAFETTEGKKIYSCKLRCEAGKGETKQLNFSLSSDNYQKGNYQLQVYHNGVLIAKKAKVLS